VASPQQVQWLHSMVGSAQAGQAKYGVPASVTLAQCILESGWGTTALSRTACNYFGVKAHHHNDPSTYVEYPTAEYESGRRVMIHALFEKYPDARASFEDHARLLAVSPRYAPAMTHRSDPKLFAEQLQACGYSTSPTYGKMLGEIIDAYELTRYDAPQTETASEEAV
jgi:flagellum-specific peptidoglycan hydrolase FlgJ